MMDEAHIARFWSKVDRNGPVVRPELGNCWIWTASKRSGYGAFGINRKTVQAHRASYELEYGEVPRLLRHKCDNKPCVRPEHLEPGTNKENTKDMLERNPHVNTLTVEEVATARRLAAEGISMAAIQSRIVAPRPILIAAIQGHTFQHVIDPAPVKLSDIYRPRYSKLSEQDYEEISEALKKPYHGQNKKLAAQYGVDPSMITLIKQGKLKTIRAVS